MKIEVKDNAVYVGKEKIDLISGEVHYWRLDPYLWKDILQRVKDLGLKVIATYICWDFHELEDGEFDFFGKTNPRRDLVGFLSLLKEMGFWVIIRPGPYIYSEWKNLGVPDHAAGYHRLHPVYLKKASVYIKEVSRIIKPFLATSGGNIILYQPDNEIDPFLYRYSHQLGLFGTKGPFKDFIQKKYKSIKKINEHWQTSYKTLNDVLANLNLLEKSRGSIAKYLDLQEFLHDYVLKCARWVMQEYKKNGINLPAVINCYTGFKIQPPQELSMVADIVGFDIYPAADFKEYNDEFRNYLEWLRSATFISKIPYIAEFESGIWYGRHHEAGGFKANHYRLKDLSALACGIKGFNWYMLVNRDNWQESPITEQNEIRPDIYEAFKKITEVTADLNLSSLVSTANVSLSLDTDSFHAKSELSEAVLKAVYEADVDYKWYPFSDELPQEKVMFYASENWLSLKKQRKLYDYVRRGGHLVFFNNACLYDEKFKLNNLFGFKEADGNFGGQDMIYSINDFYISLNNKKIPVSAPLLCYNKIQGRGIKPLCNDLVNSLNVTSGAVNKWRPYDFYCGTQFKIGKGSVLALFMRPTADLIEEICRHFRVDLPSCCPNLDISTMILKGKKDKYLFILNNTSLKQPAVVNFKKNIFKSIISPVDLINKSNKIYLDKDNHSLRVNIDKKDATVIKLS